MKILKMVFLTIILTLLAGPAKAAVLPGYNVAGFTQTAISDGTNYFGLGTSIDAGTSFVLNVNVSEIPFVTGMGHPTFPLNGFTGFTECCEPIDPRSGFPARSSHITLIELILNGITLSVDTSQFATHTSSSERVDGFCCASFAAEIHEHRAAITGSSATGSTIAIGYTYRYNRQPGPGIPTTVAESLAGSISLLLLATDGSTLIDLAGVNALGLLAPAVNPDVPLPATLPLLLAGIGGLGAMARRRRKLA